MQGGKRMKHRVTLIPGDGVGPELAEAARTRLRRPGSTSSGTCKKREPK